MGVEVIFSEETKKTLAEVSAQVSTTDTPPDDMASLAARAIAFEEFVGELWEVPEVHAVGITAFDRTPRSMLFLHVLMGQNAEALKKVLAAEKKLSSGDLYGSTALGYFDAPTFTPESMSASLEKRTKYSQDGERYMGVVVFRRN